MCTFIKARPARDNTPHTDRLLTSHRCMRLS